MADILAQLVQKADSLSALQLTGALFTINWETLCQTHLPQNLHDPIRRTFLALGGEGGVHAPLAYGLIVIADSVALWHK